MVENAKNLTPSLKSQANKCVEVQKYSILEDLEFERSKISLFLVHYRKQIEHIDLRKECITKMI